MPFVLGILMGVAGLAMVLTGKVALPGGRVIEGRPVRRAAGVWLSFLPVAFLASFMMELFGLEWIVDRRLVHWILVMLCLFIGVGLLKPAWSSARPRQQRARPAQPKVRAANPVEPVSALEPPPLPAIPEPEPWPTPLMGKPVQRGAPPEKNPFDFS